MHRLAFLLTVPFFFTSLARADVKPIGPDLETLVAGNTAFAVDLYAQLRAEKGNLFYSPFSISTALAMTSAGARGPTLAQMERVLHFRLKQQQLHAACTELTRTLNGHGLPRDYQLHVANSLWGEETLAFNEDFQKLIKAHYGARLRKVNYIGAHELARQQINRWVEERTNDKVKELLKKQILNEYTRLVLVNAIYFKSAWDQPFNKDHTDLKASFQVSADKNVTVAMMNKTGTINYLENDAFQAVELPYEGSELSMVVFLPRDKAGLAKLEQELTAAKIQGWLGHMKMQQVAVGLPRFKVRSQFSMKKTLEKMGMTVAFDPHKADFTGLTTQVPLYISAVIHQAFVDVNEEGTEAAAATAVIISRLPSAGNEPPVTSFRADHPFLFLLRDTRTGSILFMGRVNDPSAEVK